MGAVVRAESLSVLRRSAGLVRADRRRILGAADTDP
jgi:hypothetical protein